MIHIDRFGNCVTNITRDLIDSKRHTTLRINHKQIGAFREFYDSAAPNELFAIWGSAGFLEISINGRSAAKVLGAKRGDEVIVRQD
ncbi:MAG TPA: SAM hydroxide adenosyltransferase [Pyrinomonadaceae bacterium]|nr:SAM hydroxide adenosyltransferase [Pyrinomonadaceae bacterium]